MYIDLKNKPILVVGGGAVALRKTEKLLPFGPAVTVVAPRLCPELAALEAVSLVERPFADSDVNGMELVLAATDDRALNHHIARLCREQHIPVNVADSAQDSSFLFPALIRRGELTIGISTGGGSPTVSRMVREQVEAALPDKLPELLDLMEGLRLRVRELLPSEAARAGLLRRCWAASMVLGRPLTEEEVQEILTSAQAEKGEQL